MRREEARRVTELVRGLPLRPGATILNIGSSTRHFREVMQPHVDAELIRPLISAGFSVVHCDIKPDDGVDVVGDVLDPAFRSRLAGYKADVLLCCNLLEHLVDPGTFARACGEIVAEGGYIVVSVPYSYPYHKDPIDTGLRPSPAEIAGMFDGLTTAKAEIVVSTTYLQDAVSERGGLKTLARNALKTLLPVTGLSGWRARAHRFLWLFRPYKVSVAILHKPSDAARVG